MNHGTQKFTHLHLVSSQSSTARKCGTCWHFFNEPFIDHEGNEFTGCGNDIMICAGVDRATGKDLFSDIIATDDACNDYLPQEEGENKASKEATVWLLAQRQKR